MKINFVRACPEKIIYAVQMIRKTKDFTVSLSEIKTKQEVYFDAYCS